MFDHKSFLVNLTSKPGVYCMYGKHNDLLYIGKAKNLKNRVSTYFQSAASDKIINMVRQIDKIEITITVSERDALLLESNLIKELKPKYNVILRDDKSYPYVHISVEENFPRISYARGEKKSKGKYLGPYTSASDVKESIKLLQKIFKLRTCSNSFFNNRTRPCLLYQIKRCSAPCVSYIKQEQYTDEVKQALSFLEGKNTKLLPNLVKQMQELSEQQQYEQAALIRDKLNTLRHVAQQQYSVSSEEQSVDVLYCAKLQDHYCLYVLPVRLGKILAGKAYFPKMSGKLSSAEALYNFILSFYLSASKLPHNLQGIVLAQKPEAIELLQEVLSEKNPKFKLIVSSRGITKKWLEIAHANAIEQLKIKLSTNDLANKRYQDFLKVIGLHDEVLRIECFDISHTQGEHTYASCVVFSNSGAIKSEYRLYKLSEQTNGDDYKGMQEALTRRLQKAPLPDILLIDGGKGQLEVAKQVIGALGIENITLLSIAKGEGRKAGLETIYLQQEDEVLTISLNPSSTVMHFLQQIRDEAHRFAITAHRKKRTKQQLSSPLDQIEGIGAKRKQAIFNYFGGWQQLTGASEAEIAAVPGISKKLANIIYTYLHK